MDEFDTFDPEDVSEPLPATHDECECGEAKQRGSKKCLQCMYDDLQNNPKWKGSKAWYASRQSSG